MFQTLILYLTEFAKKFNFFCRQNSAGVYYKCLKCAVF